MLKDAAMEYIKNNDVDFTFLYQGYPDGIGHDYGWMTEKYKESIDTVWQTVGDVLRQLPEDYTVIITADHGGHDRIHGTDCREDMQIPLFCRVRILRPESASKRQTLWILRPQLLRCLALSGIRIGKERAQCDYERTEKASICADIPVRHGLYD